MSPCDGIPQIVDDGTETSPPSLGLIDVSLKYTNRSVGDEGTNPTPSFIGKNINNMILFRNRLGFLSGENVTFTTSGGFDPSSLVYQCSHKPRY